MKLLWLGPLHSHAALEQRRAVDQAATKWSRGLIHGLIDIGVDMRGITHCSEQVGLWAIYGLEQMKILML